jgi:hypothetical protein
MRIIKASNVYASTNPLNVMKKLIFLIILVSFHLKAKTQFQPLNSYILKDFIILDSISGDINNDKIKDLVLILKHYQEDDNYDTVRPLLLLEGNSLGLYRLMAKNDNVVLCKICGGVFGDPYDGISVNNGTFSIEHYGGSRFRWTRIITFKFDKSSNQFILKSDAGINYDNGNLDKKSEKRLYNKKDFGRLAFSKYNYGKTE